MDKNHLKKIQNHFNSKYTDYNVCCNKVVPRNEELQQALVQAISYKKTAKLRMLDLGIGTGLTTWHVLNKFLDSHIDGIDFSSDMMNQAAKRMGKFNSKVNLIEADFTKYEFDNKYDVIFSAVTIHNLPNGEKKKLFKKIYRHLYKGGCFINADFIKFKSDYLTKKTMELYFKFLKENLAGRELKHWLKHVRKEDLPVTLDDQISWLKEMGFSFIECLWIYQNLAVVYVLK